MVSRYLWQFIIISLLLITLNGCAKPATIATAPLKTELSAITGHDQMDDIILYEFAEQVREDVNYRFRQPAEQLDQIDSALTGYAKLVADIEGEKFTCIGKNELSGYQASEWIYRTIGFPNWIKSIRGHLLLEKARNIKYQILLLSLGDRENNNEMIRQREKELQALINEITLLTQDREWRE